MNKLMNEGAYLDNVYDDDNIKEVSIRSIEKTYTGDGLSIDIEHRP